MSETVLRLY